MKLKALALFLLLSPLAAVAQVNYVAVTATVVDPSSNPYAYAQVSATLVNAQGIPLTSGVFTPNGAIFNGSPVRGSLSSAGLMSLQLVPNGTLTCAPACPGNQWRITISEPADSSIMRYGASWNINYTVVITGAVDLSAQISALAQPVAFFNLRTGQSSLSGAAYSGVVTDGAGGLVVNHNIAAGSTGITNTGTFGATAKQYLSAIINGASPSSIYASFTGAGTVLDATSGAVKVTAGTQYQVNGVGGYVDCLVTVTNCVASAGYARASISNANVWGANFGVIDTSSTPANEMYGVEVDTQPQGPTGNYFCANNGLALCMIGVNSALWAPGTGTFAGSAFWASRGQVGQWMVALNSTNGAAQIALWAGAVSATSFPADSQTIRLDAVPSSGVVDTSYIYTQAASNSLNLVAPTGGNVLISNQTSGGNLIIQSGVGYVQAPQLIANSASATVGGVVSQLTTASVSSLNAFTASIGGATQWGASLYSPTGVTGTVIWAGATAAGNSKSSQAIRLDATSSGGTTLSEFIQADQIGDVVVTPQASAQFIVQQGGFQMGSGNNIIQAGSTFFNLGSAVAANFYDGLDIQGGDFTFNGNLFANTHQGLSCTGTPSSSFASVNGIVTHC